uniref:Uncharacterized protein n=1 Tax=Schistocephalus solidus TaxID=70667 RepID=A0A0X3PUC4_SCHSO
MHSNTVIRGMENADAQESSVLRKKFRGAVGPRARVADSCGDEHNPCAMSSQQYGKQNCMQTKKDDKDRYSVTTSPPAKRAKSLGTLMNVTYEDEKCMGCLNLLQKFSLMEKEISNLKQEMADLKEKVQSSPVATRIPTKEITYANIASSRKPHVELKDIASTELQKGDQTSSCTLLLSSSLDRSRNVLDTQTYAASSLNDTKKGEVEKHVEFEALKMKNSKSKKAKKLSQKKWFELRKKLVLTERCLSAILCW